MLKRTISGAVYVAIIIGMFLLRQLVDPLYFNILFCFFSVVGTFEVARAIKDKTPKSSYIISIVYGALLVPMYVWPLIFKLSTITYSIASVSSLLLISIILSLILAVKSKKTLEEKAMGLLPLIYPAIFICSMLMINTLSGHKGFIALVLLFATSSLSDVMAYLVGMCWNKIRKGKTKKLCPRLSPKKTVAGAIGGLFGGAIAGIIVYFALQSKIATLNLPVPLLLFILFSIVCSITTQVGDLFESYIKRSVNIKDMGNIMPGHGGIMDRIDGITFTALYLLIVFAFI